MKAYLYPGQGSQFEGMGKEEYESSPLVKELMDQADEILGYKLSEVMFSGTTEDLKQTRITQPAIFLHSICRNALLGDSFMPDAVAGHSLGEFSALTAGGALTFSDGLTLVHKRAEAMQYACSLKESTMAAIVGLDDDVVERICEEVSGLVVPANYNCPGQLVISGEVEAVKAAADKLTEAGARRALVLEVGGAFHSPLMEPAGEILKAAIEEVSLVEPRCPVYQNVTGKHSQDPNEIKTNLIEQLTAPVRWTQTMQNMIADGMSEFVEVGGRGRVLAGLLRRIDRNLSVEIA